MYNTKQGNASTGFEDSLALFFPKYFQKQLLIKFGIKFFIKLGRRKLFKPSSLN